MGLGNHTPAHASPQSGDGVRPPFESFPFLLGWELTLKCNLRCRHCASSAGQERENELSLAEASGIVDQLPDLLVVEVVFTGGEPLLSPLCLPLARRLKDLGILAGAVTNGTLLTKRMLADLKSAGIHALAVSVDGLGPAHDELRQMDGLYERVMSGIGRALDAGFIVTAITAANPRNLHQLDELKGALLARGVRRWQVQPMFALGRSKQNPDLCLTLEDYAELCRFVERNQSGADGMQVYAADGIGYFAEPEISNEGWSGCTAGISSCGIMSDGRVKGCLSWPDELAEGSLMERPFWDLWFDPNVFPGTRAFRADQLSGTCAGCEHGALCRGGCSAISLAMTGRFHADPYCYRSMHGPQRPSHAGRGFVQVASGAGD
jgi:radical SAM protein with 4Fe4S-binding SPASM domain